MKSRRFALEKSVSNGGGFGLIVMDNSVNLSFASPFFGVLLADNSSAPSDNNSDPYGGLNNRFNPSMAIIIVVLLSAFFFMGFFSIYVRRCAGEDDSFRASRQGARGANAQARRQDDGTHGLDRAVIESFPVFSYDLVKGLKAQTKETLECAVCLNEFEDDEQLRLLPKCSHAFHPECIDMWLFSHTTCPVCRTSLVPTDDANPTGTDYGIIEPPEITPPDEITVVVDGTRGSSRRNGSLRRDNAVESPAASEMADSQEPLRVMGLNQAKKFRRSHSTGHSLVRLPKDLDQSATEWYISTAEGLTPGLHRNCSLTARPHSRSQRSLASKSRPALAKQDSLRGAASFSEDAGTSSGTGSGLRWYERGLRSERLSLSSMNPSSFLRTHSEHRAPSYSRYQDSSAGSQQEQKAYLQSLKSTLKRLTGRDREWTDNSLSGRRSSRRAADNSQSGRGTSARAADESRGPISA
uniref:RING-type E3 ubiquitin transferase n=1 Tax=Picea sitchensis TaxID=3332 RepID=B8LN45_PICSI|nr:unknown [Picea sitchensis]